MQNALGIKSTEQTDFNTVFELLGPYASAEEENGQPPGYLQLIIVEYRGSPTDLDRKLPLNAGWKDAAFVSTLLECASEGGDIHTSLTEVLNLLQPPKLCLLSLREPRHRFGWCARASTFLSATSEKFGCGAPRSIIQLLMGPTSTVLRADCEKGACFLKSPLPNSKEGDITHKLAKIFPDSVPDVLATNLELNAFVTRGFCHAKLSEKHALGISLEMARLQVSSLHLLNEFEYAGCEVRGPHQLARNVETWLNDPVVTKSFRGRFDELEACIPAILQMCEELTHCKLPMTLVHGDLYPHNATYKYGEKEGNCKEFMLFDWEYAYIGHPFCDMCTVGDKLSPEDLSIYLNLWSPYGSVESLQRSLDLGRKLGWCIRMWRMFDYIRDSDAQRHSTLQLHARDCFDEVYYVTVGAQDE